MNNMRNIFPIACLIALFFLFSNSIFAQGSPNQTLKIGYYTAGKSYIVSNLKVSDGKVTAYFFAWDKFPRSVLIDTLLYNEHDGKWYGDVSVVYAYNKYHYIQITKDTVIFEKNSGGNWSKFPMKIMRSRRSDIDEQAVIDDYVRCGIANKKKYEGF